MSLMQALHRRFAEEGLDQDWKVCALTGGPDAASAVLISRTDGKDLPDWLIEGRTWPGFDEDAGSPADAGADDRSAP